MTTRSCTACVSRTVQRWGACGRASHGGGAWLRRICHPPSAYNRVLPAVSLRSRWPAKSMGRYFEYRPTLTYLGTRRVFRSTFSSHTDDAHIARDPRSRVLHFTRLDHTRPIATSLVTYFIRSEDWCGPVFCLARNIGNSSKVSLQVLGFPQRHAMLHEP